MNSYSNAIESPERLGSAPAMVRPAGLRLARRPDPATLAIQRYFTFAVFAVFMISIYAYKAWYIAAAAALAVNVLLLVLGGLRVRGLGSALIPACLYFSWLLMTALWAKYPHDVFFFATADAIGIVIVALFYLLALNQPQRIAGLFIAFAWIAIPLTALTYWTNPEATRSGGYSIWILPFVPPFCWSEISRGRRTTNSVLALIAVFGLLIFSRSRTPIAVAVFTTAVAVFAFSPGIRSLIKRTTIAVVVIALTFGALVYFKSTREIALTTFTRFTHVSVAVGDVYVQSEVAVDPVRRDLHKAARRYVGEFFLLGMGYHNFPEYFAREWSPTGHPFTLHSMYETWWVEGGLVCVLIVFVMFYRHFRSLVIAMRRSLDPEVRRLARVVIVASLGLFVFGLFHQTHMNPMVYALIGISAALVRTEPIGRVRHGRLS